MILEVVQLILDRLRVISIGSNIEVDTTWDNNTTSFSDNGNLMLFDNIGVVTTTWTDGTEFEDNNVIVIFDQTNLQEDKFFKFPPGDITEEPYYDIISSTIVVNHLNVSYINSLLTYYGISYSIDNTAISLLIQPELVDTDGNTSFPSWVHVDIVSGPDIDLTSAVNGSTNSSPVYSNFTVSGDSLIFDNNFNLELMEVFITINYNNGTSYQFKFQSTS